MLSTLIISAAFATGDTVGYSITNEVYDSFEEADILIAFDNDISEFGDRFLTDEFLDAFTAEFSDDPDIDGITGVLNEVLPVLNLDERLSEANASLIGVDPATADPFKGLKTLDGELIPGSTLGGLRAYVSEDLADAINVGRGDTVHVFQDGAPTEFEVIDIVQKHLDHPGPGRRRGPRRQPRCRSRTDRQRGQPDRHRGVHHRRGARHAGPQRRGRGPGGGLHRGEPGEPGRDLPHEEGGRRTG